MKIAAAFVAGWKPPVDLEALAEGLVPLGARSAALAALEASPAVEEAARAAGRAVEALRREST